MAFPRIGGAGIGLNLGAQKSNVITMPAAQIYNIPAGTYFIAPGSYTCLQWLDPVSGIWRVINADNNGVPTIVDSDGGNFRLANLTGTPIGALITNAGSGQTNGFNTVAVTPSAGSSVWKTVVGGAINSTVTVTTAGTLYTFAPLLVFDAPPAGGIQATGIAVLSGATIGSVTVTNQGAGYSTAPNITVINDPRDTTGSGAVLTVNATLAGSGTVTAMYPTNPGTVLTAVPTFTFNPASTIAATAVMNFVVTGATQSVAGVTYSNSVGFQVQSQGGIVAGTRASNVAGPIADTALTIPRPARIDGTTSAGGALGTTELTAAVVTDAGFGFQAVPKGMVVSASAVAPATIATVTLTVGGITDTSFIQPV